MIAFLLSPLGKFAAWAGGVLVIIGLGAIVWFTEVDSIKKSVTLEIVAKQQAQIIQAQQAFEKQLDDLTKVGNSIADDAEKMNQNIEDNTKKTEDWIGSQKDTVPFDPLFNKTLDHLRNTK